MALSGDTTRRVVVEFSAKDNNVASTLVHLDGRLRDVKGRFVTAGGAADAFGRTAKLSGAQAATAFGKVKSNASAAAGEVRGLVTSARGLASTIKGVGLFGLGLDAIVGAGRQAIEVLDQIAQESLRTQQVTANLQISIEGASAGFKGFVSNIDLAVAANRAVQFGVVETGAEFADIARGVQAIAEKTGQSSAKLLDQFVVGTARKSAARLDDLGILITQTKAERIYAETLGKTAKELTLLEKDEAFQKVALMEIAKAADSAATSVSGFAVTVAQSKIELQNVKSSFLGFDNNLGKVRETMRQLSDEDLTTLGFADFAAEGSGAAQRANAVLKEYGVTLNDIQIAARDTGIAFEDLVKGQKAANVDKAAAQAARQAKLENEENVRLLREQADVQQFQGDLISAGAGDQAFANTFTREAISLRRQAAELAGDEAETLKQTRALALATAKDAATSSRGGGGGGMSRADKVRALQGEAVQDAVHMAELQAAIAVSSEQIFDAEEASRKARLAALDVEREALAVTRARGAAARAELETERAGVDQAAGLIVLEGRLAAQEREAVGVAQLFDLEQARAGFRFEAQARELESQGRLAEAEAVRFEAREAQILARPPETELERITQKDELEQVAHERTLSRIEQEGAARAALDAEMERLAKADEKRKKEAIAQTTKIAGVARGIVTQGQSLAGRALDAAGVDGEKRQRLDMRIAGVSALAQGALETVKAVAAAASFNPVQAAAHGIAAGVAFATGGALLAGNIPTTSGGGAATAPAPPTAESDAFDAPTVPGSTPAADRDPSQRQAGGLDGGARVVVQIENFNPVGNFDPELVEQLATDLDNVQFSRGATG